MISLDTNILLPAVESRNADHPKAAAFLESLQDRQDVAICEFMRADREKGDAIRKEVQPRAA